MGRALDRRPHARAQLVGANGDPVLAGDGVQRGGRRADRRVARRAVDLLGDLADELVEGVRGVVDLRGDLAIDLAAGRVTPDPRRKGAVAACPERRVDHAVDVRVQLEPLRAEHVLGALERHRDRLAPAASPSWVLSFLRAWSAGQPADVDAADPDAVAILSELARSSA